MSRQRGVISRLGSLAAAQVSRAESSLIQPQGMATQKALYGRISGCNSAVSDSLKGAMMSSTRGFASGGGEEVVHEGLKLHATGGWHKVVGTTMSSVMWFWVFYRLYHDYEGFLFGHAQHFEHELHAGHDNDDHHDDSF